MELYDLYIDCDCVCEGLTYEQAKEEFEQACKEHPDSVIDVLTQDGEHSIMGLN
jgi:hypothetical protein